MTKKMLLVYLCFTLFLTMPGCKKKLPTSPDIPDIPEVILPTIEYFTANPVSIAYGWTSELSWSTTNATSATIDQGIGNVPTTGTRIVGPTETKTYVLTVKNNDGQKTASCTVTVEEGARFELTSYSLGYADYGPDIDHPCEVTGIITNVGIEAGMVCEVSFHAYNADNVIISSALVECYNWGYITPGVGVAFSVVFSDLFNWELVAELKWEIIWYTKPDTRLTQTGIIILK